MRVLTCVITGGRPALADRVTRKHFDSLAEHGFSDIEWVIRSDHVDLYETDDRPFNVYPVEWANTYAKAHWRHPTAVFEPGGFHGAFPGREWAMRTAEERGFDAVLQLDDNVSHLGIINPSLPGYSGVLSAGEMLGIMAEISASTNVAMLGAQLNSVIPASTRVVRPGYPYSVFIEKCGPGRMPYYGPFEDDIMHALEYALHGGPTRTAAVIGVFRYLKVSGGKTGMRAQYDASRGLEIARRYPQNVRLAYGPRTSSPNEGERGVRHFLRTTGFTPVRATDRDRYNRAAEAVRDSVRQGIAAQREWNREKMRRRAGLGDDAAVNTEASG